MFITLKNKIYEKEKKVKELVEKAISGDEKAFTEMILNYQ